MGLDIYRNLETGKYHDDETHEELEEETIEVLGFEIKGVRHSGLFRPVLIPGDFEKMPGARQELLRATMNPNLYQDTGHST